MFNYTCRGSARGVRSSATARQPRSATRGDVVGIPAAGNTRFVLAAIGRCTTDQAPITLARLGGMTGLGERTVRSALRRLQHDDAITLAATRRARWPSLLTIEVHTTNLLDPFLPYIERAAWRCQSVHGSTKAVLVALASFADHDRTCWPSVRTLAHRTGYATRTVQRALRELERRGLLVMKERHEWPRTNAYRLARMLIYAAPDPDDDARPAHLSPEGGFGLLQSPSLSGPATGEAAYAASLRFSWTRTLRASRGWRHRIGVVRQFVRERTGQDVSPSTLGWAAKQLRTDGHDGCLALMRFLDRKRGTGIERVLGGCRTEGRIARRQRHVRGFPAYLFAQPATACNVTEALAGLEGPIADACLRRFAAARPERPTGGVAAEIAEVEARLAAAEAWYGPGDPTLIRQRLARLRGEPEAPSTGHVGLADLTDSERDSRRLEALLAAARAGHYRGKPAVLRQHLERLRRTAAAPAGWCRGQPVALRDVLAGGMIPQNAGGR